MPTAGDHDAFGSSEIYTIGHSNRTLEEFLGALQSHGIEQVVDVRRWPTSRKHPHFSREALDRSLRAAGIAYLWMGDSLGGHRRECLPRKASPNSGWKTEGFRNYADYISSTRPSHRVLREGWLRATPACGRCPPQASR